MYSKEEMRELLPSAAVSKFDDIVYSRVLGANAHTRLIQKILLDIADQDLDSEEMLTLLGKCAQFFKDTRGQNSRAIYNAIMIFTRGYEHLHGHDVEEIRQIVKEQITAYDKQAKKDTETLVSYGVHLCENMESIMIFDYSSTVDAFVSAPPSGRHIYICESRALDGGRPFVKNALASGHHVHFIPDTTMLSAMKKCQAVFIGAETIYPDGTVFNTIGSDIVAMLCVTIHKPLYVLTPLIKLDMRPLEGYVRCSAMPFDYGERLASHWDEDVRSNVDFSGFKLLEIEAEMIRGYITEKGILPPSGLYVEARAYAKELEERQ